MNTGKYRPEKTPYLDTFHAVLIKTKMGLFKAEKLALKKGNNILIIYTGSIFTLDRKKPLFRYFLIGCCTCSTKNEVFYLEFCQ